MKPEKIYIFANLNARNKNSKKLEAAQAILAKQIETEIIYTQSAEHARQKAKELSANPGNIIAAYGGDGTINSVIQEMDENSTLGIIPAGTANVIARELGIPLDINEAAKNLLTGAIQKVDTGLCNGRRFLFVAGIGFDAHVAAKVSPFLKKTTGKLAYHLSTLKELLTYKAPILKLRLDNGQKEIKAEFIIVANMRRYGGDLFFAPEAMHNDGILDLVVANKLNPSTLFKLFNFARRKAQFPDDLAKNIKAKSFQIQAEEPSPYQLDGEVFKPAQTFYFTINKKKLNILTP
ncbi:MAG: diacylglycerol/lipid kinase family protein [Candidatus Rifleibacteriota bacterium]